MLLLPTHTYATSVTTVFEGVRRPFTKGHISVKEKTCKQIFNKDYTDGTLRITKSSSFRMNDDDTINTNLRGTQDLRYHISEFKKQTKDLLDQIFYIWQYVSGYTFENAKEIRTQFESLAPERTKLVSVTSYGNDFKPSSDYFSSISAYDSSLVTKSYSRIQKYNSKPIDYINPLERSLKDFSWVRVLMENDIQKANYTWSMGLLTKYGNKDSHVHELFTQVADLLDLHYNHREFFNLERTKEIEKDDVDIVFHAMIRVSKFYQRLLKVKPLKKLSGEDYVINLSGHDFNIFHIKGSDFIKTFMKYKYYEPGFENTQGKSLRMRTHEKLVSVIKMQYTQLNPESFKVNTLSDFAHHLKALQNDYFRLQQPNSFANSHELNLFSISIFTRFIMIRKNTPEKVFRQIFDQKNHQEIFSLFHPAIVQLFLSFKQQVKQDHDQDLPFIFSGLLQVLLEDPLNYLLNSVEKVNF
jgi:hypothetical protein